MLVKLPPRRELIGMVIGALISIVVAVAVYGQASPPEPMKVRVPDDEVFSWIGIARILISAVIAAGIGWLVWWRQTRSTEQRVAIAKKHEEQLAKDLAIATEEKERLAAEQRDLMGRMTSSEKLLGAVKEQLGLLQQEASPLFEAAKIRLIASLTHPHKEFKVPDDLLKLALGPEGYITPELAVLLKERETSTHPDVTDEEKLAAAILPAVVELAAKEAKVIGPLTAQVVTTAPLEARPTEDSPAAK